MPFSAVICLLALILMHVEVNLKSPTEGVRKIKMGKKKKKQSWKDEREKKCRRLSRRDILPGQIT